jgi:serine/threonine protein phosphatase PrpC
MASTVKITAAGKTDVGQVRSTNQDSFLVDEAQRLFIVADGMGGHAGGEIASNLCITEVSKFLKERADAFDERAGRQHPDLRISNTLGEAINHASTKIYEKALEDPSLKGMGTTATVCRIVGDHAYLAHVGDSRGYLLRCGFIYQMTNDHSLVSEQVRAGILTKEEAEAHHLRNVITRSVGYQEEEDVDTTCFPLEDGDLLLFCSDGLHGKVTDKEISLIAGEVGPDAVTKLISLANERGGDDNISVVIIKVKVFRK